jgi:formate C-acetyltransferase
MMEGGAWYTGYGCQLGGTATAGDSLTVIDELIFKKKRVAFDELIAATSANWEGHEDLRQLCINGVPKYGNDNDIADSNVAFVMDTWYDAIDWVNKQADLIPPYGGQFRGVILVGNGATGFGAVVGATPDGRKNPDPLSDTMSPVQGRDTNGTTAVMKSVGKMPSHRFTMGVTLNQRLNPQLLATERDVENFVAYIRGAEELGVYHAQYNIISSEVLRKAKAEPEKYKDLMVRVASYCSYFVELDEKTQDDIINRTEHMRF